jgi:hypothetical protein
MSQQHTHNIEAMKEIKENIEKLKHKRTHLQGAMSSLRNQESDLTKKVKAEYNLEMNELPKYLENETSSLQKEEQRIIQQFTSLYNNPVVSNLIKIQPPFTIELIYDEIQNNLLSIKSESEGQIKSLERQQEQLITTLENDYSVSIKDAPSYIKGLNDEMLSLEAEIQKMYNEVSQDEELKSLLK